jgi:hypothetical protein
MMIFGKNKDKYQISVEGFGSDITYWILHNGEKTVKIPAREVNYLKKELNEWWFYLNSSVGLVAFNLAIAIQGTPHPPFNAMLSFLFLGSFHFYMAKIYFPSRISYIRKSNDKKIIKALKLYVAKDLMGIGQTFLSAPAFLVGYSYFLFMMLLMVEEVQKYKIPFFSYTFSQLFLPKDCLCLF